MTSISVSELLKQKLLSFLDFVRDQQIRQIIERRDKVIASASSESTDEINELKAAVTMHADRAVEEVKKVATQVNGVISAGSASLVFTQVQAAWMSNLGLAERIMFHQGKTMEIVRIIGKSVPQAAMPHIEPFLEAVVNVSEEDTPSIEALTKAIRYLKFFIAMTVGEDKASFDLARARLSTGEYKFDHSSLTPPPQQDGTTAADPGGCQRPQE